MKNQTQIIDKIHARLNEFNNYFYGYQGDIVFHFNQQFFIYQLLSVAKIADLKILLKRHFWWIESRINDPEYKKFSIAKKNGEQREILAPEFVLKGMQQRINFYLQNYYQTIAPEFVYGFVINPKKNKRTCNIVENAKNHIQKKYILTLDLKDFFPSIPAYRIKKLFESDYFRFNDEVATALALLVTYENKLPIGVPCSPVLSNFICLPLDQMLKKYCDEHSLSYSRYADDLTFSSNEEITKGHVEGITRIIEKNHFEVNPKKTRIITNQRKQKVTGIIVNEKINVDRKTIKMVRAMLHDTLKYGITNATLNHYIAHKIKRPVSEVYFLNRLSGYINFIGQVRGFNDPLVIKFKSDFNSISLNNFK